MKAIIFLSTLIFSNVFANALIAAPAQTSSLTGFGNPESVVQGEQGEIYVSEINVFNKDGDGTIKKIDANGQISVFAKGMDDPKGLALMGGKLYVADKNRILAVTNNGNWQVHTPESAFPFTPQFLNDLTTDRAGNLYVSDSGDLKSGGAIYKIDKDGYVTTVVDRSKPEVLAPNGLLYEGGKQLLSVDFASGILYRIDLKTGQLKKLAEGLGGGDGIVKTKSGDIYVSDWKNGKLYQIVAGKAKVIKSGFSSPADIALSIDGRQLLIPVMKAGTLDMMNLK